MADPARTVTGGVDTHKDAHVAAALDGLGRVLGTRSFPATTAGYRRLREWLHGFGALDAVGIEGTGAWGAGLTGHSVLEGSGSSRYSAPSEPPGVREPS
jgi:transposase